MTAFRRRRSQTFAVPRLDLFPSHAHPVEQQLQMVLWVRNRIIAREWSVSWFGRGACAAQLVPHIGRHRKIEIGQNDCPFVQIGHNAQQPRQRRCRARHTSCHNGRAGRRSFPAFGCEVEQSIPARSRIQPVPFLQAAKPFRLYSRKHTQAVLPMAGQRSEEVKHCIADKLFRANSFDQKPVHRRAGFSCETKQSGACGGVFPHGPGDQVRQGEQATLRINGRWNVRTERIEQRAQRFIEIKVADNRHARHQQTRIALLSRVTDEGFGNGAARAAARQQERQACEAEFRFRVSRHQSCNKCIGEAAVGGNRIDLGPNPLSHRSMHLPLGEYGLGCRLHTSGQ